MTPQGIEDIYELSPLQSGMLFHTLLEPKSKLYFEQIVLPLDALLNPRTVEAALNFVVENNGALRTSFHWQEIDKPVQVVHKQARVPVATIDLRAVAGRDAAMRKLLDDDRARGFDLTAPPLVRAMILQWTAASCRLVLSFHHVVLDGWSVQHVFRQFSDAYRALSQGLTPPRPRNRPYADYIRWLQKQEKNAADEYWKATLGGVESACLLPPDPEATGAEGTFAEDDLAVGEATVKRLREFAARHKLTLNSVMQGAWAILLSRLTGADDVVFGVTTSGRPAELPGVEDIVGLFINTVPMRAKVPPDARLAEWLQALQQEQFRARQFDHSPLVRIREVSGFASRGSMFDTLFAFENYPVAAGDTRGASPAAFSERTNYPLSVVVVPGERLEIRLLFRTDVLSRNVARRIGERFVLLVESLAERGASRLDELPALTAEDRALLAAVNDTASAYPSQSTIAELWREWVAKSPGAIAIEHGARTMTYAELDRRSNQLAARLQRAGVGAGDAVAMLIHRSMEAVIAMLAAIKVRAAYVPIDEAFPPARIGTILADTGARVVVAESALAQKIAREDVLVLDPSLLDGESDAPLDVRGNALDAAYIMYTSGSTGVPKGVVIPHRGVIRLVRNSDTIDIVPSDRIANVSNGAFDAATYEIWGALLSGATLVILDRETLLSPAAFAHELRARRISALFLTAALFHQVIAELPDAFATLRALLSGGDTVDPRRVREMFAAGGPVTFTDGYGPTESTTFATHYALTGPPADLKSMPIGKPVSNSTIYVLDASLRQVPPGAAGELYIGGDGLAHGYHRAASLTAARFLPDPFIGRPGARMYRTGDKVRLRFDGTLDFLGRLDHQIKLRGYRIELPEIETRLLDSPDVRQAVVTLREIAGERRIVSYVVLRGDAPPEWKRDLRRLLRKHLPEYMQPWAIEALPALPMNTNGKIDHGALPEPRRDEHEALAAPATETERKLAQIWQQLLGADRVGIHDAFFDVGGHSLHVTQFVSRIRRDLGVELPLREVFEHPTIADLARLLDAAKSAPHEPAPAAITRTSREKYRVVS